MRTQITKYEDNDVYLLRNGSFIYLKSVEPVSRFKQTESDRRCYCIEGHRYDKAEFKRKSDKLVVIENEPMNQVISFDVTKEQSMFLDELRKREVLYLGKLDNDSIKIMNKMIEDNRQSDM